MRFISLDDFDKLNAKTKKERISNILEKFKIAPSFAKYSINNNKQLSILYKNIQEYLQYEKELTKEKYLELVNKTLEESGSSSESLDKDINVKYSDIILKYKNVGQGKYVLSKHTSGSVAYDLYLDSCITDKEIGLNTNMIKLLPQESKKYGTGIAIELPEGYHAEVVLRSSFFKKENKVILANSVGIIDNDYRGEIILHLVNVGDKIALGPGIGERIAQLIIRKTVSPKPLEVNTLNETERGKGGFGSTGK